MSSDLLLHFDRLFWFLIMLYITLKMVTKAHEGNWNMVVMNGMW